MEAKEKRRSFLPRIAIALIALLVVVYTIYHVLSIFAEDAETIVAGVSTEVTSISGNGYVFRDETLLYSENTGVVSYLVSDGEKVKKGQAVADVYEKSSVADRELIALIDRHIAVLESSIASSGVDMTELRQSVSDTYYSIMKKLSGGSLQGFSREAQSMLRELNMIQSLLEGDDASVGGSLEALKRSRNEIFASAGNMNRETVSASGYFYREADGYERRFSLASARDADGDTLYSLISSDATIERADYCYGKISESSEWLFVLPLSADEEGYFEVGNTYSVNVLSGSMGSSTIPMTLERALGTSTEEKTVLLVFSCDYLPREGNLERTITISIDVDSVSGIYVPRSAIAYMDGQRGVYILKGSVVRFRAIDVVYIGKDYYLVSEDYDDSNSEFAYLTPNELIIVNGQNMFDGRIMD